MSAHPIFPAPINPDLPSHEACASLPWQRHHSLDNTNSFQYVSLLCSCFLNRIAGEDIIGEDLPNSNNFATSMQFKTPFARAVGCFCASFLRAPVTAA
ncbi:MAG TPA: hypothetical protein VF798_02900 [Burkholderiaceae bacterium]